MDILNKIISKIAENPMAFVVIVIIIIAICVYLWNRKRDVLVKAALYAVSKAEDAWGSDTGRIKFAEVYTYLRKEYPIITFFLSEKQLSDIIEEALKELKKILATKEAKENIIEEKQI